MKTLKLLVIFLSLTSLLYANNENVSTSSGDFLALTIQPRPLSMAVLLLQLQMI